MSIVLVNLDLGGNAILGLRLETLASDPVGGDLYAGRLWFNSTSHQVKTYDGTSVVALGGAGVTSLTVDNASIENTGTSADPAIRVKANGVTNAMLAGSIAFSKLLAPAADVDINSHKLLNVTDPTSAQDAATKNYVDAVANGLAPKDAVRAASTANGTLASAFANGSVVDGVTLATGDRILLKNQTTTADNGIYLVAASGAPSRALDADSSGDLLGAAVFVSEGTINGNTQWVMTTDAPITVGSTGLVWAQFAGAGTYTAGTGLSLSGTQFALTSPVAIANGGTGQTTAAAALAALGGVGKFSATIGDGSSTAIAVTHSLGTRDVHVCVYDASTFAEVIADVVHTSTSVVTITFAVAPASNAYRVVVIG